MQDMDDDIIFGASVWETSRIADPLTPRKATSSIFTLSTEPDYGDDLDNFDDFGATTEPVRTEVGDDDFGDFEDFGQAEVVNSIGFEEDTSFGEEVRIAGPSSYSGWFPLKLDPFPARPELEEQVNEILQAIWDNEDISGATTNEDIREMEGVAQILVTSQSRDLYKTILQSPPPTKPPNWTRSRIRRQHLIALGIPVNLDEVLPRTNGEPLPPLHITTRPVSAPPGPRPNGTTMGSDSRAATPQLGKPAPASQFGPKPDLDVGKIEQLLALNPETLTILPLPTLERHLADLGSQTAKTSALLTHLLQIRESLQQDSETYNGLIAELVGEAQKIKSGKPRTGSIRRGSGMN